MVEAWQAVISADVVMSLFAVAFGFAFAGLCDERLSPCRAALAEFPYARSRADGRAALPLLIFSAPYLIMHNTLRGDPLERRRGEVVMVATVIAGLWSLMSGTVVVMALQALLSV